MVEERFVQATLYLKTEEIILLNVDFVVRNEDYLKKCDYNFQYDLSSECLRSAIKIKHVQTIILPPHKNTKVYA